MSTNEWWLADRLTKIEDRLDALTMAMRTADVCSNIGHTYTLPDAVVRQRIEMAHWRIERRCEVCGNADGVWQPTHWTLPEFTETRLQREPHGVIS